MLVLHARASLLRHPYSEYLLDPLSRRCSPSTVQSFGFLPYHLLRSNPYYPLRVAVQQQLVLLYYYLLFNAASCSHRSLPPNDISLRDRLVVQLIGWRLSLESMAVGWYHSWLKSTNRSEKCLLQAVNDAGG